MTLQTTDAFETASPAALSSGLLSLIRARLTRWREIHRIREELGRLNCRELAELGLVPADIDYVARGLYRR